METNARHTGETMNPCTISMVDLFTFNATLGIYRLWDGVDYYRYTTYPRVFELLELHPHLKILDIGVGTSIFPLYLAAKHDCTVEAIDLDKWLGPQFFGRLAKRFPRIGVRPDQFSFRVMDACKLNYPNDTFDRILTISTLEHIPGEGDVQAMREIARVLKPGGICIVDVPYNPTFLADAPRPADWYFARRYDEPAVQERLIKPSRLSLTHIEYFGEFGLPSQSFGIPPNIAR